MPRMSKQRFTVIPAVYLVIERAHEVLLLRRANTGYRDGEYSLPAGHHDGGESLLSAMVREAREEVGIDVHEEDLRLRHVMHRNAADGERVDFYFSTEKWLGDVTNCEPEKCDELHWASYDELPEAMIPEVRQALYAIRANQPFSVAGWS